MASWHMNSFMLALNQDCWLGINGVPARYSGQNYINFVKAQVTAMEADGIYPVLTAQVGEPGTDTPNWSSTGNGNAPMPDKDHYPLWWEEIANEFKSDPNVIFRRSMRSRGRTSTEASTPRGSAGARATCSTARLG